MLYFNLPPVRYSASLTQELGKFFQEVPDAMERTAMVRKLEEIGIRFQNHLLDPDQQLAKRLVKTSLISEIVLSAFFLFSESEQTEFFKLIDNASPGRIYFKNRIKSLKRIR